MYIRISVQTGGHRHGHIILQLVMHSKVRFEGRTCCTVRKQTMLIACRVMDNELTLLDFKKFPPQKKLKLSFFKNKNISNKITSEEIFHIYKSNL
jgi:hypothetical protein